MLNLQIKERIHSILQHKNPSHAYILAGDILECRAMAMDFAKALQCDAPLLDGLACNDCLSCRVFVSGNHPDIIYVKPTKTKAIGVDDIREQLVLPMSEKPFRYPYKIFITEEELTTQAQNALLKTIEEPAPFGIFFFLTKSLDLFLPTVLSRCVVFKLAPNNIKNDGHVKDTAEVQQFAKTVADNVHGMDVIAVYKLCAQFDKFKETVQDLLDVIYSNLRDQLQSDPSKIYKLDAVAQAKKALYQNGNFQMTIETMLLKMR